MTRHTAVHIGRSGEVAGGMTQVVNGYLTWRFDDFDTRMITSRDGGRGPRSIGLVASAVWRVIGLRNRSTTVVVVHLSQGGSFVREGALLRLASARGFATVAHLHGSSFAAFAKSRPRLVARVLRSADLTLTLSDETREVAARFVSPERVVLLPNAVAPGDPQPKEDLVVFGGAVSVRKGVDVLVAAWRALQEQHPHSTWRLIVAGPEIDAGIVPSDLLAAEFVGPLDHDALMSLLDRSAVAVLPSRDEAMPLFILEAMARANCIVSTTVGGIPALLADGAGVLVPPGNAEALRASLALVMTDATARRDYARRAVETFETHYSHGAVFPVVERSWKAALDARLCARSAVSR